VAVHSGRLEFTTQGDGDVIDLTDGVEHVVASSGVHDTNSHAHMRAAIVGPSESVPIEDGRLATGTWQQLVLIDFDDRPRRRTVSVTVVH
jgi:thiamine phosphate synthase YjbQ (UPF0047 family)